MDYFLSTELRIYRDEHWADFLRAPIYERVAPLLLRYPHRKGQNYK